MGKHRINRPVQKQERRINIYIFCEGKITETNYISKLIQNRPHKIFNYEIAKYHGEPHHLVDQAIEKLNETRKKFKSARLNLEVQHFRIQDDVAWPNPIGN